MGTYLDHTFSADDPELVSVIDELPFWSAPFGLDLLKTIRLKPTMNVLDVGCGLGFPLLEVAFRAGCTSRVIGLDPWERALDRIRLKVKVLNIRNVEVVKGVAENMPFESDHFDLLVSNNGMNNVADMRRSFAECSRVSKPGAQFVLTFNLPETMLEFYDVFEQVLRENRLIDEIEGMKAHIASKRKPLSEVLSLIQASAFTIADVRQRSFCYDFVDGTTMFHHYLIKYWFLDGWKKVVKLADHERIFGLVEGRLNDIAHTDGCIHLTVPYATVDCTSDK